MYRSLQRLITVHMFTSVICSALTAWKMHDVCGTEIYKSATAGELHLDSEHFLYNEPGKVCKVTITPEPLNTYGVISMVLFYFTSFELYAGCDVSNVTIIDGTSDTDRIVPGLPRYVCGVNSTLTLTDQTYSTTGESLTIIFNTNSLANNFRATFNLTFVTYHTGSCSESDSVECSNGHCIPLAYNCSNEINACGEVDANCTTVAFSYWFGNMVKYLSIFGLVMLVLHVFKSTLKGMKNECCDFLGRIGDCFRDTRRRCQHCSISSHCSRIPKPRLLQFIRHHLRSNNHNETTEETEDPNNAEDTTIDAEFSNSISDSIDSVVIPTQHFTTPSALPPTYEEVIASSVNNQSNVQTEDPSPSYEETILHDTYIRSTFQTEDPSPTYEEVMHSAANISSSPLGTEEHPSTIEDSISLHTNSSPSLRIDEPFNLSDILNHISNQFEIDLSEDSDEYSTDPDWDSERSSSVMSAEQITVTQSDVATPSDVSAEQCSAAASDASIEQLSPYSSMSSINDERNEYLHVTGAVDDTEAPPPYYYDYMANVSRYK